MPYFLYANFPSNLAIFIEFLINIPLDVSAY